MEILLLGGAGAMAKVTALDLKETSTADKIVLADLDVEGAEERCRKQGDSRFIAAKCDAGSYDQVLEHLKTADLCINSAQYYVNYTVMQACLETKTPYIDLGGLFHMTMKQKKLHDEYVKKGIPAVLGMGSTPGSIGVLASYAADRLDTVAEADAICTWKEFKEPKDNTPFIPPYALRTILEEISEEPWAYIDGRLMATSPLSGEETINFPEPFNRVKCFRVLHSEPATWPDTWKKKGLKSCSFKIGMPDELFSRMQFLARLGLAGKEEFKGVAPIEYISDLVNKQIRKAPPDALDYRHESRQLLRARVRGARDNLKITYNVDLRTGMHSRWAVVADTGVPPSIVAGYILEGKIPPGVWAPEEIIEPAEYFRDLAKREMYVTVEMDYEPVSYEKDRS